MKSFARDLLQRRSRYEFGCRRGRLFSLCPSILQWRQVEEFGFFFSDGFSDFRFGGAEDFFVGGINGVIDHYRYGFGRLLDGQNRFVGGSLDFLVGQGRRPVDLTGGLRQGFDDFGRRQAGLLQGFIVLSFIVGRRREFGGGILAGIGNFFNGGLFDIGQFPDRGLGDAVEFKYRLFGKFG